MENGLPFQPDSVQIEEGKKLAEGEKGSRTQFNKAKKNKI